MQIMQIRQKANFWQIWAMKSELRWLLFWVLPIYYQKAQIQITQGNLEGAIETLKYADKLLPEYSETQCYLAKTLLYHQKKEEALEYVDSCIDLGGASRLTPASLLKTQINEYINKEDWERVIKMYKALKRL